jgi:hypothetical protein
MAVRLNKPPTGRGNEHYDLQTHRLRANGTVWHEVKEMLGFGDAALAVLDERLRDRRKRVLSLLAFLMTRA